MSSYFSFPTENPTSEKIVADTLVYLLSRCTQVVNAVRRGRAQASLLCGARGCTVRHERREAIEAAVQADPGLRVTAAGLGGRPDDGEEERRDGLCYPLDQTTLGLRDRSMMSPSRTSNNASPLLSKCSQGWLLPTPSLSPMCLASSTTHWESIVNPHNRRRRNHS